MKIEPESFPDSRLSFVIDPGICSPDELRNVLRALSEYQIAHGGLGLTFEFDGHFVRASSTVLA